MVDLLEPVSKQFTETYDSIRHALAEVPDDRLNWTPGPKATSVVSIMRHIIHANLLYSTQIEGNPARPQLPAQPDRTQLLQLLDESQQRVHEVFEKATVDELRAVRAEGWGPLGYDVEGP